MMQQLQQGGAMPACCRLPQVSCIFCASPDSSSWLQVLQYDSPARSPSDTLLLRQRSRWEYRDTSLLEMALMHASCS